MSMAQQNREVVVGGRGICGFHLFIFEKSPRREDHCFTGQCSQRTQKNTEEKCPKTGFGVKTKRYSLLLSQRLGQGTSGLKKYQLHFGMLIIFKCLQSRIMKPGRISPRVSFDFYHLSKAEQLLFSGKLVWEPEGKEKKSPRIKRTGFTAKA